MNVTRISDYQNRDTVSALKDMLARAQAGKLRGVAFAVKTGAKRHLMGMTGEYWDDPHEALSVATRMEYKINQVISGRDDEQRTDFAPL